MPIQPARKPSGIETRPGFSSGKSWKSTPGKSEAGLPETTGESSDEQHGRDQPAVDRPDRSRVVKFRQKSE